MIFGCSVGLFQILAFIRIVPRGCALWFSVLWQRQCPCLVLSISGGEAGQNSVENTMAPSEAPLGAHEYIIHMQGQHMRSGTSLQGFESSPIDTFHVDRAHVSD